VVDLNPLAGGWSYGVATSGNSQVGWGYGPTTGGDDRAFLWQGTAASAVNLHPAGYTGSQALDISGNTQVGSARSGDFNHAMLWTGTAASAVDLHPPGFAGTVAYSVSGSTQVGTGGGPSTGNNVHALLWTGTAASKVDLHPAGFTTSTAYGVSGTIQVGQGAGPSTGNNDHALLWQGTAASFVDLHPAGFTLSTALAASPAGQVGGAGTIDEGHAMLWHGTPASAVDLHAYLSFLGNVTDSQASDINDAGVIFGTVTLDNFESRAVIWSPLAESGVAGDYNNNGIVDTADYIAWRKNTHPLFNEVTTIGSATAQDYTEWRKRFGNPPASGTLDGITIPEPSALALLAPVAIALLARKRAR
jgi:hypothetical protein